jgi:4'-phosphopantetheinyl transferase
MQNEAIYLWFARPDDFTDREIFEGASALLSDSERSRMRIFKFEASQREYLAAHFLVRTALAHQESTPPQDWRFRTNEYGRPSVDPACGLFFSLSRRRGLVACLIAHEHEVGLDLESTERAAQIIDIAPRVFSPKERAQLDSMTAPDKSDHAVSLWTLKEAYCKARGLGFSLPLQKLSFLGCPPGDVRLELDPSIGDSPERWRFCLLDRDGHRIALMVERLRPPRLEVRVLQPFQAPSLLPENPLPTWFPLA